MSTKCAAVPSEVSVNHRVDALKFLNFAFTHSMEAIATEELSF